MEEMEEREIGKDRWILDLKQVFKGGMFVGIGNVFLLLVSYIGNVIITRTVGAEIYGLFNLALTITGWFTLFLPLGLPMTVYRYVPKFMAEGRFKDAKAIVRGAFYAITFAGFISGVLLFVFAGKISQDLYREVRLLWVLRILSVTCLFVGSTVMLQVLFLAIKRVDVQLGITNFSAPLLRIIFVVVLFLMGLRLYAIVYTHLLVSLFIFVLSIFYVYRLFLSAGYPSEDNSSGVSWSEIIKFAVPMYIADIIWGFWGVVDISILGYYLGARDVGIYNVGKRLSTLVSFALSAFNTLYAPILSEYFTRGEREKLHRTFKTVAGWSLLGAFLFMGLFTFSGREILSIFGSEFKRGYSALIILSLGQLVNAGAGCVGWALIMSGKQMYNLMNVIIAVAIDTVLNFFLIPKMGIEGAALAVYFAYTGAGIFSLLQVWMFYGLHPFDLYYLKKVLVFLISFLLSYLIPSGVIPAFITRTLVFTFLFVALFLLFARSDEDTEIIKSGLRKIGIKI